MTLRDQSDVPRRSPPEYRVSQTPRAPGWVWLEIIAGMGEVVAGVVTSPPAGEAGASLSAADRERALGLTVDLRFTLARLRLQLRDLG